MNDQAKPAADDAAGRAAPRLSKEQEQRLRDLLVKISPGPWGYNSYSAIHSAPLIQAEDDAPDYPEGKRPGPPFFTEEDNAWLAQRNAAYDADPFVAWVPSHYGDTATGRHQADADFIELSRDAIPAFLIELDALRADLAAATARAEALAQELVEADRSTGIWRRDSNRWMKLAEDRLENTRHVLAQKVEAEAALADERAGSERLRSDFRRHTVHEHLSGFGDFMICEVCQGTWSSGAAEEHESCCALAQHASEFANAEQAEAEIAATAHAGAAENGAGDLTERLYQEGIALAESQAGSDRLREALLHSLAILEADPDCEGCQGIEQALAQHAPATEPAMSLAARQALESAGSDLIGFEGYFERLGSMGTVASIRQTLDKIDTVLGLPLVRAATEPDWNALCVCGDTYGVHGPSGCCVHEDHGRRECPCKQFELAPVHAIHDFALNGICLTCGHREPGWDAPAPDEGARGTGE